MSDVAVYNIYAYCVMLTFLFFNDLISWCSNSPQPVRVISAEPIFMGTPNRAGILLPQGETVHPLKGPFFNLLLGSLWWQTSPKLVAKPRSRVRRVPIKCFPQNPASSELGESARKSNAPHVAPSQKTCWKSREKQGSRFAAIHSKQLGNHVGHRLCCKNTVKTLNTPRSFYHSSITSELLV